MTRPDAVALFVPALVVGGITAAILAIAEGLARRGLAVDLVVINATGECAGRVPDGVALVDLNSHNLLTALPPLVAYLRRRRPDILIAASWYAVFLALVSKRFFVRDIRTWVRQDGVFSGQVALAGPKHRAILAAIRRLLPAADLVIAVSDGVARDLERSVPRAAGSLRVVANPVYHDGIAALAREPSGHPWLDDPEVPVILSAGRLVGVKDYPTLVRAFAAVRERIPSRLVILGAGRDRDALVALARRLGVADDLDLPGFVPNPFPYMARAWVFVVSSLLEGLSMALVEAMACGTPVVSTDCPCGPREVLEDGRLGALAPVGDPAALAGAIVKALRNPVPPDLLVARARHYSVERSIDRHMELILESTSGQD